MFNRRLLVSTSGGGSSDFLPLQLTIAQSGFSYGFAINDNFGKLVPYQNLPMQGDNTITYTIAFILNFTINLYIHKSIKGINTAIKVVFPELSDEPFNFSMNDMASTGLQATYTNSQCYGIFQLFKIKRWPNCSIAIFILQNIRGV